MRNKKAMEKVLEIVIFIPILLLLLYFGFRWLGIIGQQTASVETQSEYITKDCDGDQVQGTLDACPCSKDITESKMGQKCPPPDIEAATNCPNLCKIKSVSLLDKSSSDQLRSKDK